MENLNKKERIGKKIGKLGVLGFVMIVAISIGTILVQNLLGVVSNIMNLDFSEYFICSVSGSSGMLCAAIIAMIFMKKSKWWVLSITSEKFSIKKMCCYAISIAFICKILYEFLFTLCFASTIGNLSFFDLGMETGVENINLIEKYIVSFWAILIAPITEELLFRKCFYSSLKAAFGVKVSMVFSIFIFAIMHGYGMQGLCSCILAGALFTYVFEKTGHICYTIATHMLCNVMASLLGYLEKIYFFGKPLCYEINGCNTYHIGIVFVAVSIVGACIYSINEEQTKNKEKRNVSNISSR